MRPATAVARSILSLVHVHHPMLYGAYRLLRLGLLVDSPGLSGAEPEAPPSLGEASLAREVGAVGPIASGGFLHSILRIRRAAFILWCDRHMEGARSGVKDT